MQQVGKCKEVCDAVVLEQLMEVMLQDLRVWLKERQPTAAVEVADNYVAARRERRICSICSKP